MKDRVAGTGGVIALDKKGNIGHSNTTLRMVWATAAKGKIESDI
jgi:isoaspartyl peptidase/L-asparaginase-like protein (Ntn-hydrolase superfamily)